MKAVELLLHDMTIIQGFIVVSQNADCIMLEAYQVEDAYPAGQKQ
jgi:hypothetical protein